MLIKNGIKHIARVESAVANQSCKKQLDLDNPIVFSWARSLEKYGLDPGSPAKTRILTHSELVSYKESRETFLRISRAGLERLFQQVYASGYVVLLADDKGVTIDAIGDPKYQTDLKAAGLCEGALWAENEEGTCGVGTCIETKQALTIHKTEHFRARHIDLTCTTAPIFDPQGKFLGAIDASALYSPDDKRNQSLVFQLVAMAAKLIENAFFLQEFRNDRILSLCDRPELAEVVTEHLLALNFEGQIIAANSSAILHLDRTVKYGLIGRHISEVFNLKFTGLMDLFTKCSDPRCAIRAVDGTLYFAAMKGWGSRELQASSPIGRTKTTIIADRQTVSPLTLERLAGKDRQLNTVVDCIKRIVNKKLPIILSGETGTGKEAFAQAIHQISKRAEKPFVAVNCVSIPETLIESELFGYKQGAFTGACSKGMRGRILQSSGGTLFLDEIGDMPLPLQARLLRVLAEQEVVPLGSNTPVPIDLNVICATHQNLEELVAKGAFREDLFYRLNGILLKLPPIRERSDKRVLIDSAFAAEAGDRYDKVRLDHKVLSFLEHYPWPGNIRQLRNALRFALAINESGTIGVPDLPPEITHSNPSRVATEDCSDLPGGTKKHLRRNTMEQLESEALINALKKHKWKISSAARDLGIGRATIYRKMEKYAIVPPNMR